MKYELFPWLCIELTNILLWDERGKGFTTLFIYCYFPLISSNLQNLRAQLCVGNEQSMSWPGCSPSSTSLLLLRTVTSAVREMTQLERNCIIAASLEKHISRNVILHYSCIVLYNTSLAVLSTMVVLSHDCMAYGHCSLCQCFTYLEQ